MITKKSYKFLGQHYFLSSLTCATPYTWNPETYTLSAFKSKPKLFVWYLHFFISAIFIGWHWRCFILGYLGGHRHVSSLAVDVLFGLVYVAQLLWQFATIFMMDDFASLTTQLINFDRIYTQKYCSKDSQDREVMEAVGHAGTPTLATLVQVTKRRNAQENENMLIQSKEEQKESKAKAEQEETDGCDANIFMSFYMMFVYAALTASMFVRNPGDDRYLYASLMKWMQVNSDTQERYHLVKLWTTLEYFHLVKFCFCFNNIFYIIILYAHSTNFWLQYLSYQGSKKDGDGVEKITDYKKVGWIQVLRVNEAIRNYKAAQVLNIQFNECCAWIVIPIFKSLNVALHVMATFVTITFHGQIPIGGYLIFPIGFVMWCAIETDVYPLLGKIDELSRNYLESWKPRGAKNYSRHFKAMFPLNVKVSSCYYINKSTVLCVWSAIFNMVVNCIVF